MYFDNNASTETDPLVLLRMQEYTSANFGNPSSSHSYGRKAKTAVETARSRISRLLKARPKEIIFTSGGTESNNLAILGFCSPLSSGHIISVKTEHKSVIRPLEQLQKNGFGLTWLPLSQGGLIDPAELEAAVRPDTVLVTVMLANGETGLIQPIKEIGKICRKRKIRFHCDAVQAIRKIEVNVDELGVDTLSISSHKIYGPQGVGALFLKAGKPLAPILLGGPHEGGKRSGTENVPGIVGLGEACRLAGEQGSVSPELTGYLYGEIIKMIPEVHFNGDPENSLPQTLNLSFEGVDNAALLISLDQEGIAVSTGSACMAGSLAPSSVLLEAGYSEDRAKSAIRFSLGKNNTPQEVKHLLQALREIVSRIRSV